MPSNAPSVPPSAALGAQRVWRYLTFSRFVWLLQKKQLWLSRADLLSDSWEITLAGDQLAHVIARHPPLTLPFPDVMPETAMQRAQRIIAAWRRETFISCWSSSDHESHALWRIYCGADEGVAIQTTFARLKASVGSVPLLRVAYETPGSRRQTPDCLGLASQKRPMFAYEHEVRLVDYKDGADLAPEMPGYGLDWEPEKNVESIRVHPQASASFHETVVGVVEQHAPALSDCVAWSDMTIPPPF